MEISYSLINYPQLVRMLKRLPWWAIDNVARAGLRAGGIHFRKQARLRAPHRYGGYKLGPTGKGVSKAGGLRRRIKVKMHRKRGLTRDLTIDSTAPHSHLVEFGTTIRYVKKPRPIRFKKADGSWATVTGKSRGQMPATRFMTRTFDQENETAFHLVADRMRTYIQTKYREISF